jgi:hypothetical protein
MTRTTRSDVDFIDEGNEEQQRLDESKQSNSTTTIVASHNERTQPDEDAGGDVVAIIAYISGAVRKEYLRRG